MSQEHTKEPWRYGEDNDGWYVEVAGNQIAFGLTEANARRIVAAVNACAGIATEALESEGSAVMGWNRTASKLIAMSKQRDELLAALETMSHWHGDDRFDGLIASVKGQA